MVYIAVNPLGSALLGTAPLTQNQLITCWALGFGSLIVHPILKQIPVSKFAFAEKIDLEGDPENSLASKMLNKAKNQVEHRRNSMMNFAIQHD